MKILSPQAPHQKLFTSRVCLLLTTVLLGCGGEVPQPVAPALPTPSATSETPGSPSPLVTAPIDPFAVPAQPRDEATSVDTDGAPLDLAPWKKARQAKGVSPPPASCAAFSHRAASKDADAKGLVEAFAERDPAKRDARLVMIGTIPMIKGAWPNAVRADLAPIECADAIVDPYLETINTAPTESPSRVRLVVGFSLAGKLARTAAAPPAMGPLREKEKVKAFVNGPLKTWLVEQSTAIEVLSSGAAGLSGYARGIAAIEAGIAEMRLVDKMRSAPVPASWDPELKAIYETALDEALEPRKKRGRDAALVGMSDLAKEGILHDSRIDRARVLLTRLYGGRRIDALDALLLPAQSAPATSTPQDLVIANTPLVWLDHHDLGVEHDPRVLSRGVTKAIRADVLSVEAGGAPPAAAPNLRSLYGRTRLDMGRVYWRRVDFVEAAHAVKGSAKPEDRLVLAVSLALAAGPNGAAEMMRAPTPALLDLKHTEALDALVAEGGPLAGMAAYDAAHLRALSPPDGDGATPYLRDVSARFRKAESLLTDPALKKNAAQRAGEVDAIIAPAATGQPKP